ncbi:MAG: BrnT family toxin [Thiobacillaceae bacterium]
MLIEFDPEKDAVNIAKHGVSLSGAARFDWENALIWEDRRRDYGELRQVALTEWNGRLYTVVFVDRGDVRRIISLRKANLREFDRYETETDSTD